MIYLSKKQAMWMAQNHSWFSPPTGGWQQVWETLKGVDKCGGSWLLRTGCKLYYRCGRYWMSGYGGQGDVMELVQAMLSANIA